MKGYYNGFAYMGFVPSIGKYQQFESENAYRNYLKERGEIYWNMEIFMILQNMVMQTGRVISHQRKLLVMPTIILLSLKNQRMMRNQLAPLKNFVNYLQKMEVKNAKSGYIKWQMN